MADPTDVEYLDDTIPLPLYQARELNQNYDLVDDMIDQMNAIDTAIDLHEMALRAGHVH